MIIFKGNVRWIEAGAKIRTPVLFSKVGAIVVVIGGGEAWLLTAEIIQTKHEYYQLTPKCSLLHFIIYLSPHMEAPF